MKELFIPELGTELKLTEDWEFKLYPEGRNSTLLKLLGFRLDMTPNYVVRPYQIRIDADKFSLYEIEKDKFYKSVRKFKREIYQMDTNKIVGKYFTTYPLQNNIELRKKERENCFKETVDFIKRIDEYTTKEPLITIIPKDSTLIVDRIYVRKGNEQFNSVSFYWKDKPLGKGFKKYVRFWAKLEDVNKIKFNEINE